MKTPSIVSIVILLTASIAPLFAHADEKRPGHPLPARLPISLRDFKLTGDLTNDTAAFTLTAIAKVEEAHGGTLEILSGNIALTSFTQDPKMRLRTEGDRYTLVFDKKGEYPVRLQFDAAVAQAGGWNAVAFHVAPGVLQPIALRGMAADSQFRFPGAARLDWKDGQFASVLPEDGSVNLSWKEARRETEGKLFFSAELLEQISVSPGLLRQAALFHFKVMQGELNRVSARLHGAGEITRVQGDQVLSWNIEAIPQSADHRLVIQLNQAQRDQFALQIQAQQPLGAFPQTAEALRLSPELATGFSGSVRVVNEGAVRLEVAASGGMSQISPEQFPESDATRAAFRPGGNQRFAYHFAGGDSALRIQADQILPELSASELLSYHYGESEIDIDAEIELDIREAPLRELLLRVPRGFAVARLNAPSLSDSDYALSGPADSAQTDLRLTFGQPLTGRQLIQLRLERNQGAGETNWSLPRIDVAKAATVRGFAGLAADAGFRLTTDRSQGLTEMAPAFFPGKLPGIQSSFRLTDPNWSAVVKVERLPQTVQASVLHLFSIGEGIAYGSSVINYVISGAPVSSFRIELSNDCANVEFTGKDIRGWQTNAGGYVVQLHTPVSGAYTLLATYERPFKAQGDQVEFVGARPLDAQSEQGYTLVTSAYQFQVKPEEVSPALLPLEPAEVPPEYRLFTDAPLLAAYRYGSRPFNLRLSLSPLAQGDSLKQVVDRALLETHISKEGQAVTSIRYFIKNRGRPDFRLTVPKSAQLWSALVNGVAATPVVDGPASLIPLPQSADPNAVLELDLKMAAAAAQPELVHIEAPVTDAPVMLAEWKLEPDTGRRLVYQTGSVSPDGGTVDVSGFAQLARLWHGKSWADSRAIQPSNITLLAPVQQAGSPLKITVQNVPVKEAATAWIGWIWPAGIAVVAWIAGLLSGAVMKFLCRAAAWTLLAWAALRTPNGAGAFIWVLVACAAIHGLWPLSRRLRHWKPLAPGAPATAALLAFGIFCLTQSSAFGDSANPDSVTQTVRVEDRFALGSAKIHWQAEKGQSLSLVSSNAVLTAAHFPVEALELVSATGKDRIVAKKTGAWDIDVRYEAALTTNQGQIGFSLPTPSGLVNRLELTVAGRDVDAASPDSVSTQCEYVSSNTTARFVLKPGPAWIGWKPRSRDAAKEKAVFYAEISPVYVPSAGVVEGIHAVVIRPAQGEVGELLLRVPAGATVTDVSGAGESKTVVSVWRFDPDTRQLRVNLNPPQSRSFTLSVRTRQAVGPFPIEQSIGLLGVENAASQIGLAGLATGSDVQLDSATAPAFSPINLEDFPSDAVAALQPEIPGLTLRRAFRYTNSAAAISIKASAVEPDVRVETQDTLSLGEDRTVLADNVTLDIRRAGIFDWSFALPAGFEVESISGASLSQWTESKSGADRIITLHLLGKTTGAQSFALSLAGAGVKTAHGWTAPQIVIREAAKQQGTYMIVPEQGMRLQTTIREGCTQLDPQKSGIRQRGVLAFRILQAPSRLVIDIDQVDAWVQVTGWQHADISQAQIKVSASFQYQIENTGLKSFRLRLPTEAQGVRFQGEQVGDFLQEPGPATNGLQTWEVKLRRRVMGPFLLQLNYEIPLTSQTASLSVRGIEAQDVNSQRGFVTVQSDPRIEVSVDAVPAALQPAEWQSIPRELKRDLPTAAASLAYRLVEPGFQLPLKLVRHEAAKLLPARVNYIELSSAVADDGVMLTQARLEIVPGDKRLLSLSLPPTARFWFAFVNDSGVWPWRDSTNVLIPLEQQSAGNKPATVEIYYSCQAGSASESALNMDLAAPKFDLPLENITWHVSLGQKWHVQSSSGALQLERAETEAAADPASTQAYLANETNLRKARTAEAEQFLALGNNSLQTGDPQQARRAFQAAYGLSRDDAAFNEDARVQLHNVKLQEALIGFNARQSSVSGDAGALGGKFRALRGNAALNYTQQDAKDILDNNSADDNAAFMRQSEKLVQQQDAAVTTPAAIRANIPQQGQRLTFRRSVAVDSWASLNVSVETVLERHGTIAGRAVILGGVLIFFAIMAAFESGLLRPARS